MTIEEYYTSPSDEIFEDIKQAAIKVWGTFDDTFKYATGKIDRIKDIGNVKDNYAYMVAMFDYGNKFKLFEYLERQDSHDLVLRLIRNEMEAWQEKDGEPMDPMTLAKDESLND